MMDYEFGATYFMMAALALFFPLFAVCAEAKDRGTAFPHNGSLQAITVITENWASTSAILQCYERNHPDAPWRAVGIKIPATVGRNGLAWGTGLHPVRALTEPVKKEGDGKAPAGIFSLRTAFGYGDPNAMTWIRLPYRQASANLLCIDDPASAHYNRIVDAKATETDWNSHEVMQRPDDQYRLGIVVEHNAEPITRGQGSCIFIHIWEGPDMGTSGCTALAAENLEAILRWLHPQAHPVLIQLPETIYSQYRQTWSLP